MGTNYYVEQSCVDPCVHCEATPVHICKSHTSFQGHKVSPWGRIESWSDWKRILGMPGVKVVDEYGETHDREDFIQAVEETPTERRRSQFEWMRENGYPVGPGREWLDADEFSFTFSDFT